MNSVMPFQLSESQVAEFKRDGYVVAPRMFDPLTVARIAGWTDEVVRAPETPGRHMVYYEDDRRRPGRRIVSRIENFCPFFPSFNEFLNTRPALDCLAQLFGEPAVMFKDKINFKLPGGDGFKAHQDVQAGWDTYGSLHITMLISIDASTRENGCLEIAAGAHRDGLLGERWQPLADPDPRIIYQPCPTQPGDAIFFDSYVPHRSQANETSEQRRILYMTYGKAADGDHRVAYYADKRKNYPPDCERDPAKVYRFKV